MGTLEEPRRHHPDIDDLELMHPGSELGAALASLDRDRLSDADRVIVMQAWNRQVAHAQAEPYLSMTALAEAATMAVGGDLDPADLNDLAASEIRAALAWTRRAADSQLTWPGNWWSVTLGCGKALHAQLLKAAGDPHTVDQIRADPLPRPPQLPGHRSATGRRRGRRHQGRPLNSGRSG